MSQRVRAAIALAPPAPPGGVALDISAGDGLSSRMLAERGWRLVSPARDARARAWVSADLDDDLPFRARSFDLVMMLEVIEHLADIPHALREIARVLKPGAPAVVSTPNRLNIT